MTTATLTPTRTRTTWRIDPAHTMVELSVRHMMIARVKGRLPEVSGTLVVDLENPDRSTARIEIQAASIDTRSPDRDTHLRSADFLDVEKHPTITFVSRRVEGASFEPGERFRVAGDLTLRGVTREVVLDAEYHGRAADPWGGTRAGFSATTAIDRHDFGLRWNQALETGGVLVGQEVKVALEVEAVLEDEEPTVV